jgi:hypothetical protein
MKITKRQLRRLIKENTSPMPLKSRAHPEIQKMVSNSRRQQQVYEVYPIGGESGAANLEWQTFRDAAYDVAAGFIDAGMEADGVMDAMQDEIEQMINEMESEWLDDEPGYGSTTLESVRGDIMTREDR